MELNVIYNGIVIDPLVNSIRWSGDVMQASRKLDVSLNNTEDGATRRFDLDKGAEIRFLKDGQELFRGVLFQDAINVKGQHTFTAYDENIYLTKNQHTYILRDARADQGIQTLCSQFQIPIGSLANTGYVMPKLILRQKTLWDMFITMLTETEKQNGRRFVLTSRDGKLYLRERKEQVVKWVLEGGVNITDASYSQSMEDLRTQVRVEGGDDNAPLLATVKDDALIKKFGLMQHLEKADGKLNQAQINDLAAQLLKQLAVISDEARITALGIDDVTAGSSVYVMEKMTGITGGFYISTDEHSFEKGTHTMSLSLSATDELPKLEYTEGA